MNKTSTKNKALIRAFKNVLFEQNFVSQQDMIAAMANRGYHGISQAKISRLLAKVGAVKVRNERNEMVYQLPSESNTPQTKQFINSMVLQIKHNHHQIVVKTILGGGHVIARIIESLGESSGVLATLADESVVLVIPTDVNKIATIKTLIVEHLELTELH